MEVSTSFEGYVVRVKGGFLKLGQTTNYEPAGPKLHIVAPHHATVFQMMPRGLTAQDERLFKGGVAIKATQNLTIKMEMKATANLHLAVWIGDKLHLEGNGYSAAKVLSNIESIHRDGSGYLVVTKSKMYEVDFTSTAIETAFVQASQEKGLL